MQYIMFTDSESSSMDVYLHLSSLFMTLYNDKQDENNSIERRIDTEQTSKKRIDRTRLDSNGFPILCRLMSFHFSNIFFYFQQLRTKETKLFCGIKNTRLYHYINETKRKECILQKRMDIQGIALIIYIMNIDYCINTNYHISLKLVLSANQKFLYLNINPTQFFLHLPAIDYVLFIVVFHQ